MKDYLGEMLAKIRVNAVFPYLRGRLLDIGCGNNYLVGKYGNGIGVDVYDWGNVDILITDPAKLQFNDLEFNTITFLASFNHIPNRKDVLKECHRLLSRNGRLIITMISPSVGLVWHKLRRPWDPDQKLRGMKPGEAYGLSCRYIMELVTSEGFNIEVHKRFMLGINSILIFRKVIS
jgi:ubiquinone/menaquinone biosynthesis C-methylase UbiE